MNALLQKVVTFAQDNKAMLIKAGSTVVGAALGAVVGTIVSNQIEEVEFFDALDEIDPNAE